MTTTTTTVRLGGGRGRWWLVGAVVLAAGAFAVTSVGGGEPVGAPASSSTSTSSTTSTSLLAGAPLLGRPTGWHLVVPGGDGAPTTRVVDLDTGEVSTLRGPVLGPGRPDGVFTRAAGGPVVWRPFPFERATGVELGSADLVLSTPGSDLAWLVGPPALPARLVTLAGGSVAAATIVRSVDLPPATTAVGITGAGLVVDGAGDAFVLRADGFHELADGRPVAVLGGEVLVQRCETELRCTIVAVDAETGVSRIVPGLEGGVVDVVGPAHPDGRLMATVADPTFGVLLLGRGTPRPVVPDGTNFGALAGAAWSPDGALLFVPDVDGVRVVDPFGDGGPREITMLRVRGAGSGQLAVVQPRSED